MSQTDDAIAWIELQGELLREVSQSVVEGGRQRKHAARQKLIEDLEAQIERVRAFLDERPQLRGKVRRQVDTFLEERSGDLEKLRDAPDWRALSELLSNFLREDTKRRLAGQPVSKKQIENRIKQLKKFRDSRNLSAKLLEAVNDEIAKGEAEFNRLSG